MHLRSSLCTLLFATLPAGLLPGGILQISRRFPAPSPCVTGLAWDGKHLWASDRRTDTLYALERKTGKAVRTIPSPGWWPAGLAWDGTHLWCADRESRAAYQLNAATGQILKTLKLPAKTPSGLACDGTHLWVADQGGDIIFQFNPEDGARMRTFRAASSDVQGLAFDGTYLWASDRVTDELFLLTTEGDVILVAEAPGPYATGLAFDGENLWNADYQSDMLVALNPHRSEPFVRSKGRCMSLTLNHEVRNLGPGRITTLDVYFALPVDRPNQEIHGKIDFHGPQPRFLTDRWGQKIAHFSYHDIPPEKVITSSMRVRATLYEVNFLLRPEKVKALEAIPPQIRSAHTEDGRKYMLRNPTIQKAAREAVGKAKNPYWIARNIYRYLHRKLSYKRVGGWDAAPVVLERGNGSCSEYSFAYIALARASGLPARYVGSVVVRGDDASFDNVFHRWVEVYLPPHGWIPVDPSAGDSPSPRAQALRFGHLANRYLITTEGGGPSRYMKWTYNVAARWQTKPKSKLHVETIGEWEPGSR